MENLFVPEVDFDMAFRLIVMDLSRFSHLPGIDKHNADVYESTDLPEDEQAERLFRPGNKLDLVSVGWFSSHTVMILINATKKYY